MLKQISVLFFLLVSSIVYASSEYAIQANYNPEDCVIHVKQNIRFVNTFKRPISEIYFAIDNTQTSPNSKLSAIVNDFSYVNGYESAPIRIKKVYTDQTSLEYFFEDELKYIKLKKYAHDKNILVVRLKSALAVGDALEFTIDFLVNVPARYSLAERLTLNNVTTLRFGWYPVEFTHNDTNWNLDVFAFKPHRVSSFEFKVPDDYQVVHSDGNGAVRNTSVIIAPQLYEVEETSSNNVRVRVVYLNKKNKVMAQKILTEAVRVLDYYFEQFGKKSFTTVTIANSPVQGMWGMASDAFIFIGDAIFESSDRVIPYYLDRYISFLVAHEIGHLWAGVGNAINFYTDNYLSEGLTNYLTFSYLEQKYGFPVSKYEPKSGFFGKVLLNVNNLGIHNFLDQHYNTYRLTVKNNWLEPLNLENQYSYLNNKLNKDYSIGYLSFRQLASYVGESNFLNGLRLYFKTNQSYFSIDDFFNCIQQYTPLSLSVYKNDWFLNASMVDFYVANAQSKLVGQGYLNAVNIVKNGTAVSNLPVEITYEDGKQETILLQSTSSNMRLKTESSSPVRQVLLDPNLTILESNKQNNSLKRDIDFYFLGQSDQLIKRKAMQNYFISVKPFLLDYSLAGFGDAISTGVKVTGTNQHDHIWKLGYGVDHNSDYDTSYATTYGEFSYLLSRFKRLTLSSSLNSNDEVDLGFSFLHPIFKNRDIGLYGKFYLPETYLSYTFRRFRFDTGQWSNSFIASLINQNYRNLRISSLSLEIAPENLNDSAYTYESFSASHTWAYRIKPRVLLLPGFNYRSGRNLVDNYTTGSFRGQTAGTSNDGNTVIKQSLDLIFPIQYGQKKRIGDLFIYRGLAGSTFLEFGNAYDTGELFDDYVLTGGVEFNVLSTTLADMKLSFSLGYGQTLAYSDAYEFDEEIYFALTTPLSLYAYFFGY